MPVAAEPWTTSSTTVARTPPAPPPKRQRRVAEDLEGNEPFQTAYAKWERIAARSCMPNYCHARTWRGVQCTRAHEKDSVFCKQHQGDLRRKRELPYGRFDTPILPDQLHLRLHRAAVCDKTGEYRYYSRDKMWEEARKCGVKQVEDLTEDDFTACLAYVDEYFAKHPVQRRERGVEEKKGPRSFADLEDEDRMMYCGSSLKLSLIHI